MLLWLYFLSCRPFIYTYVYSLDLQLFFSQPFLAGGVVVVVVVKPFERALQRAVACD